MTESPPKDGPSRPAAELITVLYLAGVVFAANAFHLVYILFPELAALTSDVLLRPRGKWAKEPWKLVVTPVATAALGTFVTQTLPYGVLAILLVVCASLIVIYALRSNVSPAISAGVLPLVLGIKSWLYPLCIFGSLSCLAVILLIWRRSSIAVSLGAGQGPDDRAVEVLESPPGGRWWLLSLLGFVSLLGVAAQATGWRFILFPPLIVMAYEMLGHPGTCPWAKPPYSFPLVCTLAAGVGVASDHWLGVNPVSAVAVLASTFVLLRLFRLRLPPALAIGLIPFVLPAPNPNYVWSVAIGTVALTGWFLAYNRLQVRIP